MSKYDVIVVGTGATGAWSAKLLTESGLDVLLLDAGPVLDAEHDVAEETWMLHESFRDKLPTGQAERQPVQSRMRAWHQYSYKLFIDDVDNPYGQPDGQEFDLIRSRQVGGRMLLWGGVCFRMSDHEFQAAEKDGIGPRWPFRYAEIAPFYDEVERYLGVSGSLEGIEQLPDGQFLPPRPLTPAEILFQKSVESRWKDRRVIIARGVPRTSYSGAWPKFTMNGSALIDAAATGRLSLRPDAIVDRVTIDARTGRATGVSFFDRNSHDHIEISAEIVMLCASTIESTRLLLNSRSPTFPNGLGNHSGLLGQGLMDHPVVGFEGVIPDVKDESTRFGFWGPDALYIPKFRNVHRRVEGFLRGYGIYGAISRSRAGPLARNLEHGTPIRIHSVGEMLPRSHNRVTLDPTKTDAWGIPAPHIEFTYSDNELAMARDAFANMVEMASTLKTEASKTFDGTPLPPGRYNHVLGSAPMGSEPGSSVLNPTNQCWETKNVFVTDGACWPTGGCQNPTLTMMAIAGRACHHLVAQLKRGDL